MPDDNTNDLERRLAVLSSTMGVASRNNTQPTNPTAHSPLTDEQMTVHLNWKALYKWLESEVEELILNPNASPQVKTWADQLLNNGQRKMREFLYR